MLKVKLKKLGVLSWELGGNFWQGTTTQPNGTVRKMLLPSTREKHDKIMFNGKFKIKIQKANTKTGIKRQESAKLGWKKVVARRNRTKDALLLPTMGQHEKIGF